MGKYISLIWKDWRQIDLKLDNYIKYHNFSAQTSMGGGGSFQHAAIEAGQNFNEREFENSTTPSPVAVNNDRSLSSVHSTILFICLLTHFRWNRCEHQEGSMAVYIWTLSFPLYSPGTWDPVSRPLCKIQSFKIKVEKHVAIRSVHILVLELIKCN